MKCIRNTTFLIFCNSEYFMNLSLIPLGWRENLTLLIVGISSPHLPRLYGWVSRNYMVPRRFMVGEDSLETTVMSIVGGSPQS